MRRSRRAVLAGVGAGVVALAGCSGGGGSVAAAGDCTISDEAAVSELDAPVAGDPEAEVTLTVFEDFACPHCRDYHLEVLPTIWAEYVETEQIRYEHRDLPIPVSQRWSWWVASAARGVQDTVGDAAFFEFASTAFERQSDYSMSMLAEAATSVDADPCAIQNDAANEVYRPVLEADRSLGQEVGVDGAPETIVNGEFVDSNVEAIGAAIESNL